jgi:hypothetical protein
VTGVRIVAPPELPTIFDLDIFVLVINPKDLATPGTTQVMERRYAVRGSPLRSSFNIRYVLSENRVVDSNDWIIGSETVDAGTIGLGVFQGPGPQLTIPEGLPNLCGAHIIAQIDPANEVLEWSESNNRIIAEFISVTPDGSGCTDAN